jgi:hypothetical protein
MEDELGGKHSTHSKDERTSDQLKDSEELYKQSGKYVYCTGHLNRV